MANFIIIPAALVAVNPLTETASSVSSLTCNYTKQSTSAQLDYCNKFNPKDLPNGSSRELISNFTIYIAKVHGEKKEYVSWHLRRYKTFEPNTVKELRWAVNHLEINLAIQTPLFVDIGANVGWHSLHVAMTTSAKVYSFEAMDINSQYLRSSVCTNKLQPDKILVFNYGIGSIEQECDVVAPAYNMLDGHIDCGTHKTFLSRINKNNLKKWITRGRTQIKTLETILGDQQIHVLKIDVEGFEPNVFLGAQRLATKSVVPFITFEYDAELMMLAGANKTSTMHLLADWGYKLSESSFQGPLIPRSKLRTHGCRHCEFYLTHESIL